MATAAAPAAAVDAPSAADAAAAGVVVVVVAVLVLCPWFCFEGQANVFMRGPGPCKRKIRTPAPGLLIYNRHTQKENKNPSPWGSCL